MPLCQCRLRVGPHRQTTHENFRSPVPQAPERASAMKEDPNTLRCGSLLFYKGLQDKSSNFRQSNAVASCSDYSITQLVLANMIMWGKAGKGWERLGKKLG
eukprot:1138446-Pelagomonas_calceolata.AAC.3